MRLVLPILLAAAIPSPALCGELGPTSRGSVTIRVTVPQHVEVASVAAAGSLSGTHSGLCLVSNGTAARYRVSVVTATGPRNLVTLIGPSCGEASPALPLDVGADSARASGQPVTLLVAPE